jgi:hypothetical protein
MTTRPCEECEIFDHATGITTNQTRTSQDTGERIERANAGGGLDALVEGDNEDGVEVVTLHVPGWSVGQRDKPGSMSGDVQQLSMAATPKPAQTPRSLRSWQEFSSHCTISACYSRGRE